MAIWRREQARLGQSDESSLGSIFVVALAFFLAVLFAIGGLLRYLW